jgi:hypothetical protein
MHMRLHINLDEETVKAIDELAGKRGRSAFIRDTLTQEVERQRKMKLFWSAFGSLPDFAPGATAETIREERRESTEAQNRKLAKHWGYDPSRLDSPD